MIVLSILLAGAAIFLVVKLLADHNRPTNTQNISESSNVTSNTSTVSNTTINSTKPQSDDATKKNVTQYEGEDSSTSESLSGIITASRVSGQNYIIRVNIDQYLTSGTCHLTFTDGEVSHTETANIIPNASSSTCEGFDVTLKALASGHTYDISIDLVSGDKSGRITGEANL